MGQSPSFETLEEDSKYLGCIFGIACGDAIGFSVEGNPSQVCVSHLQKIGRWLSSGGDVPVFETYFPFGQITDDTQLARELIECCLKDTTDAEALAKSFGERLIKNQGKFVGLGKSVAKAITQLHRGNADSGTPEGEAGNSPAIRGIVFGMMSCAMFEDRDENDEVLFQLCLKNSVVTHKDERCIVGSFLMCVVVRKLFLCQGKELDVPSFLQNVKERVSIYDKNYVSHLEEMEKCLELKSPKEAAKVIARLGVDEKYNDGSVGITGFIVCSTLWSLYSFLSAPHDFFKALEICMSGGGDTDSTCGMTCALSGAFNGSSCIPKALAKVIHDQEEENGSFEYFKSLSVKIEQKRKNTPRK